MNFYNLRSIVAAQKSTFAMRAPTDSFRLAPKRLQPYIQPTFSKVEFPVEKPAILLISAVGATGKSTLAQVLSSEASLPLLDLGKHKPVGDNTLTGLLTTAFYVENLTGIFEGIQKGTYGVIIDGIDEARSKVTDKAFEAFLDDIVRLCAQAENTSFVLLERTQIMEECWLYLTEKGATAGLITINPFALKNAQTYIDDYTGGLNSRHEAEYRQVRDRILGKLASAFTDDTTSNDERFLSFIGYPPVLDAVVTLLHQEQNFYGLLEEMQGPDSDDVEINLLYWIASYILRREKMQKVLPNVVSALVAEMPEKERKAIVSRIYEADEQCMRLVSYCLGKTLKLERISESLVNARYEEHLAPWLPEHPFITGRQFRNAVFEAVALATLISSSDAHGVQLALEYLESHKYNYHLVYFLYRIAPERRVPISCLQSLLGSALEFRSTRASVELHVEGSEIDGLLSAAGPSDVEIQIEIVMGTDRDKSKTFVFESDLLGATAVHLGQRLSSTYISLPCEVVLSGTQELELTAPIEISATKISLRSQALVLRHQTHTASPRHVLLVAESVDSSVRSVTSSDLEFIVAVADRSNLTYPLVQFVYQKERYPQDPLLKEKYLRLKRILLFFRSHSKGSLAKYKDKIEHERVAGNTVGRAILKQLLKDGILILDGPLYFLQPDEVDHHLGVSWMDLKKGRISEKLVQYLRSIS